MSFNLEKYLTENNLTIISKIREDFEEDENEPSDSDIKKTDLDLKQYYKDKAQYEKLKKDIKKIMSQYTEKQPDGSFKLKPGAAAQYKKAVGNMPYELQRLRKKIEPIETPKSDSDEEDI